MVDEFEAFRSNQKKKRKLTDLPIPETERKKAIGNWDIACSQAILTSASNPHFKFKLKLKTK